VAKKAADFGGRSMRGVAIGFGVGTIALVLALSPPAASAQQASGDQSLNDTQLLGMRLFNQSCRVCHTKPQLTSPLYGPELSQNSLGGQEAVMREVISNGTPRMPGFKYHFEPAQIEAIVAYLKTIPTPPAPASPAR
jgi:mono/diheme cytochrome c family protein